MALCSQKLGVISLTIVLLVPSTGCRSLIGMMLGSKDRSIRGPVDEPGISDRERISRIEDNRLRSLDADPNWTSGPNSWNSD